MKDYYNDLKKLLRSLGYDGLITKLDQIPNKENNPTEVIKMYNKYKRMAPPNNDINRMQELAGIKIENVNMGDISDISKSNSEINQDLQDELDRLGIDPSVDGPITITFTNKSGKTKTVTMEKNGSFKVINEINLSKTVAGIALTCSLISGMMSCTVDKDVRPNNTKTEIPSGKEQNAEPVDFLNVKGKDVSMDNITSGLAKWTPKPIKGDTNQYKQPTMKSNVKRIEVRPDSVVVNSNTPWIGYWKFTDECRVNNHQVMIWSQVGDDPLDGIIYSGYQVGPDKADWSHYQLIGGKGYFLSAYKISSFDYDKSTNHATVYMSAPDVDKGATQKLEIDFNGNQMNIINWGAGRAVRVGDMSGFKW